MGIIGGSFAFYHFPRIPQPFNQPLALPDFGYDLIPYWCPMVGNANPQSCILLLFYSLIFLGAVYHTQGRLIMQRLLHLNILVFVTRTTTVFVTGLPQPNPRCTPIQSWNASLLESIKFVWRSFPPHACGDLIYSGHVACILVCMVIFHRHDYYLGRWEIAMAMWGVASLAMYAVISCRSHYTVDVILAFYFVFFIQEGYFLRSEGRSTRRRNEGRRWNVSCFIRWLEAEEELCHDLKPTPISHHEEEDIFQ